MAKRTSGWLISQHGAYAMLAVPFIAGLRYTLQPGWWLTAVAAGWVCAYMAFNAITLSLKAPKKRKASFRPPLITYSVLAAVFGVVSILFGGLGLLGWVGLLLFPGTIALWCAATGQERSVLSGMMTTLVASAIGLVVAYPSLTSWLHFGSARLDAILTICFGYFFGTVLHVKALVREHGKSGARFRNLCWHVLVLGFAITSAFGTLNWWWAVLALGWLVRSCVMSWFDSRGRISVSTVGLVEVAFSLLLLLAVIFA